MLEDGLATVREVVAELAQLERGAGSQGEREAARRLAVRLGEAGAEARIDDVEYLHGYARLLLPLGLVGIGAGLVAERQRRRRRIAPAAAALLGVAALVDDVSNGPRIWRRLAGRRAVTTNVVADLGPSDAERTLVVMAHHDAAPTGLIFDQGFQRTLARRLPEVVARIDTSLPLWWPVVAGPLLVATGALTGRRRLVRGGIGLAAAITLLALDVARDRIVPGANDNLSGVAALVLLAQRISAMPRSRVRVMLVSCGAEEVLQGGIYAFAARHFPQLPRDRTWFLNLDSIGSPELLLVEGEGPFRMEDYHDPGFRDLVADAALSLGDPIRRGVRARASTDGVVPNRAGYPTTTLASWEPDTKLISNYHLMTDTADRLCAETVVRAVDVALAVVDALDPAVGRAR
jgi:hypothetical protein